MFILIILINLKNKKKEKKKEEMQLEEEDVIQDIHEDKEDMNKQEKKKRKKRFFEYHIQKILKHISKDKDLTNSSKILLNNIAITTSRLIRKKTLDILNSIQKRTITEEEISIAVKLLLD